MFAQEAPSKPEPLQFAEVTFDQLQERATEKLEVEIAKAKESEQNGDEETIALDDVIGSGSDEEEEGQIDEAGDS